ncbi:hypothetical protein BDP55DRAFT_646536 [Colletotrichum godetiae]|uniref:Uncharacterized protein n=1 Tax=Colletotrichum godetiae TaxID=1209918 RepID=A0AAJ0B021_9PEZI|nr:uncharacterized protein BDP55DRAFT_646536 [Colletotrichum godetiae]KAK1691279.1 hypothetical protein BDP55DRAFT_646536 [Colletotrichum godetiae]
MCASSSTKEPDRKEINSEKRSAYDFATNFNQPMFARTSSRYLLWCKAIHFIPRS